VHNKGTFGQALQAECMEVWNISIGKKFIFIVINPSEETLNLISGHAAFRPKELQCVKYAQKLEGLQYFLH
jgi:hypothetical protein